MVGKPNIPSDLSQFEVKGAAMHTPELREALDQEREASMADEGGCAGAIMESEAGDSLFHSDQKVSPRGEDPVPESISKWAMIWLGGLVLGAGAVYLSRRWVPSESS